LETQTREEAAGDCTGEPVSDEDCSPEASPRTPRTHCRGGSTGRLLTALALLLALICLFAPAARAGEPARPDVVIVVWDCARADHLSHLGYRRPTTPALDRLAREGLAFSQARTNAPWTLPAVTGLFSGLQPWAHGAGLSSLSDRNLEAQVDQISLAGPEIDFLSDRLVRAGYEALAVSANVYVGRQFFAGRQPVEVIETREDARAMTDLALARLQQAPASDKPRLVYLHYMDAHFPIWPPARYRNLFVPQGVRPPDRDHGRWDFPRPPADEEERSRFEEFRTRKLSLYDGALRYLDDQLARLAEWAGARGALLVVLADHGEEFWDHQELEARIYSDPRQSFGLGHGHTLFEELLRVPLVLSGPGFAGGIRDFPAQLTDVWPTLAARLGLDRPAGSEGRDLRSAEGRPVQLAGANGYGQSKLAVIDWPNKYIVSHQEPALLFDLQSDPAEGRDLSGEAPRTADRLARELAGLLDRRPSSAGPKLVPREAVKQRLKDLGYL